MYSGDEVIIFGKKYTLMYPSMGMWVVCETDNPNAKPVLKQVTAPVAGRF